MRKSLIAIGLLFVPALFLYLLSIAKMKHKYEKLDVFGEIPAFVATDINGDTITNDTFKGKIVIYTTLQETCPVKCGINLWFMDQLLMQQLKEKKAIYGDVRIVSFVTDANGNPSHHLADMQEILKENVINYDPKLWLVVSGKPEVIFDIEHNGQNLKNATGGEFINNLAYNSLILLADKKNQLRMVMRGDIEGTVRTMKQDLALLYQEYAYEKK